MGKAKKKRTHRTNSGVITNRNNGKGINSGFTNDLEADLGSLEESRRVQGCSLLCDLYSSTSIFSKVESDAPLHQVASNKILGLLVMRLVDSSVEVRVRSAHALKLLSECNDDVVFERIINSGLFNSAISLAAEESSLSINNTDFVENLLYSVANVASNYDMARSELITRYEEFINLQVRFLNLFAAAPDTPITLASAAINVLIAVSKAVTVERSVLDSLWNFTKSVLVNIHQNGLLSDAKSDKEPNDFRVMMIVIECSEVFINLFVVGKKNPALLETLHIDDILAVLSAVFKLPICKQQFVEISSAGTKGAVEHMAEEGHEEGDMEVGLDDSSSSQSNSILNYQCELIKQTSSILSKIGEDFDFGEGTDDESQSGRQQVEAIAALLPMFNRHLILQSACQSLQTLVGHLQREHLQKEDDSSIIITNEVISIVESTEGILSAIGCCLYIKVYATGAGDFSIDVPIFLEFAQVLLDLIGNTTPSFSESESSAEASCKWNLAEDLHRPSVRGTLHSAAGNTLHIVGGICKQLALPSTTRATGGPSVLVSIDDFKALAMLLVRCSGYPSTEIVVPAVAAIGCVGQRAADRLLDKGVNAILTNAVLRRLQNPNGYSATSSAVTVEMDISNLAGGITTSKKSANVTAARLRIMDVCFNSLIDLHASDELVYLDNFRKLQCVGKIVSLSEQFGTEVNASINSFGRDVVGTFFETLENTESFIQYKTSFMQNSS